MTGCSTHFSLSPLGRKPVAVSNDGGALSSDAGFLLLREADRRLGLTRRLAACLAEWRAPHKVRHSREALLAQRLYQIALGYEDANDANALRHDPALKLALDTAPGGPALAGQSSLSRLENHPSAKECVRLSEALLEHYLAPRRARPPTRLVLDPDTTDDPCHGQQQGSLFSTHYGGYGYLPLLVFVQEEGTGPQHLIAAILLPGKTPSGACLMARLRPLLRRLQQAFPKTRLEVRADGGFAAPEVFEGCDAREVPATIALPQNQRLLRLAAPWIEEAQARFAEGGGETVRVYGEFSYQANRWAGPRQVVVKAEVSAQGVNPRFVASPHTDLEPEARYHWYCQRGDAENRIKELKADLCADRLSCHRFLANQVRLLLHAAAYLLVQALQQQLTGTELETAQVGTLRLKLLKVGVRVRERVRRVALSLPSAYPYLSFWERCLRVGPP